MSTRIIAWLLNLENVKSIDETPKVGLSAPWAQGGGLFWVFLGVICLFATSLLFYLCFQQRGRVGIRIALGLSRGTLLSLLFLTLAVPVMYASYTKEHLPYVYVVIDGTDSMAIEDQLPGEQQAALVEAINLDADSAEPRSRMDYVRAWLENENNSLAELQTLNNCQLEVFLFDGNTTSRVKKLDLNAEPGERLDADKLTQQLSTAGQVTAVGNVLSDVSRQFGTGDLEAVVVVSDFANNAGAPPLARRGSGVQSPADKLGVPIYAVGVGATEAIDLAVDIQTDPKMKKAERTNVLVKLRQTGLRDEAVLVNVFARSMSGETKSIPIGQKTITLAAGLNTIEFPFTPEDAGRYEFVADVEPIRGEIVTDNNRATREVNVIDDYLRLMYVANEPTWEWRFIKEVFHRDKLIGMEGFRTYLASSDARVRETNVLFLPTLTPKRSDFFANDVIFIGDMPRSRSDQPGGLSDRFCEMTKEYVSQFGGGLVVICGPRFGLRELEGTPLADMLPVVIDPDSDIHDDQEFPLQLTAKAETYPFMNLGGNDADNGKAWDNLGRLQWYQPVAQKHELAEVLAEHPRDLCHDGKTKQPLIAIRRYGKGEVVYIGFNEMWRLRRKYGEKYYRQFWSQLIYRLGMSHALGAEKRFVARADRQQYNVEEKVTLTVEAYDENFEAIDEGVAEGRTISAEMIVTGRNGEADQTRVISIPLLKAGVFETRLPVYVDGEYQVRVTDPVTGEVSEVRFDVANTSAERRSAVRDEELQNRLARETRGRSYDLTTVGNLTKDLELEPIVEHTSRTHPLWNTPLWFIVIVSLMLGEWFIRKLNNLT